MGSVLVAYSGGVDSTFLLKVAADVLKDKVLAVSADSPVFPRREKDFVRRMVQKLSVRHRFIKTRQMSNPFFIKNGMDRCYWCKKELFAVLSRIAKKEKLNYVIDGTNFDDLNDYRPGSQAAREFNIRSPLREARFTKDEIRKCSRRLGLPTWDKPASACLVSRLTYGLKISKPRLKRVERAEEIIRQKGFRACRLRDHGALARIEVPAKEIPCFLDEKTRNYLINKLKKLKYRYITLDLEGYRTGSMN